MDNKVQYALVALYVFLASSAYHQGFYGCVEGSEAADLRYGHMAVQHVEKTEYSYEPTAHEAPVRFELPPSAENQTWRLYKASNRTLTVALQEKVTFTEPQTFVVRYA